MRGKNLVAFVVLLSLTCRANAATWVQVGEGHFIDTASIQRSGQSVTFWVRGNHDQRQQDGSLSSKVQSTINCMRKEHIGRYYISYEDVDAKGRVILSTALDVKWTPIAPDSNGEMYMRFVCR